jgi:hypothetical protein
MIIGGIEAFLSIDLGDVQGKLGRAVKAFLGVGDAAEKASDGVDDSGKSAQQASSNMDDLAGTIKRVVGVYAGLATVNKALDMAGNATAARNAAKIFRATGGDIDGLRKATRGLVDDGDLFERSNFAKGLGIDASTFKQIASTAITTAKVTGKDANEVIDSIVMGVSRQSEQVLRSVGIAVNAAAANEAYALSLGITADALTDVQREQAFQNAVFAEGRKQADLLARAGVSLDDPLKRLAASAKATAGDLEELVRQGVVPVVDKFLSMTGGIGEVIAQLTRIKPAVRDVIGDFAEGALKGVALAAAFAGVGYAAVMLGPAFAAAKTALLVFLLPALKLVAIGAAIAAVAGAIGYAWKTNFGGIREIVGDLWTDLKQFASDGATLFGQVADSIVIVFMRVANTITNALPAAMQEAVSAMLVKASAVADFFGASDIAKGLNDQANSLQLSAGANRQMFSAESARLDQQLLDVVNGAGGPATKAIGKVVDAVVDAGPGILAGAKGLLGNIGEGLGFFFDEIKGGLDSFVDGITDPEEKGKRSQEQLADAALAAAMALDQANAAVVDFRDVLRPQVQKGLGALGLKFGPETQKQIGTELTDGIAGIFSGGGLDVSSIGSALGRAAGSTGAGAAGLGKVLGTGGLAAAGGAGAAGGALGGVAAGIVVAAAGAVAAALKMAGDAIAQVLSGIAGAVAGIAKQGGDARLDAAVEGALGPPTVATVSFIAAVGLAGVALIGLVATVVGVVTPGIASLAVALPPTIALLGGLAAAIAPFVAQVVALAAIVTTVVTPGFALLFPPMMALAAGFVALSVAAALVTGGFALLVGAIFAMPLVALIAGFVGLLAIVTILTGGFVGLIGMVSALLPSTEAFGTMQSAVAGSMDRLIRALEPFGQQFIAIAGLFDVFIDVVIPLVDTLGKGTIVSRALFEVFRLGFLVAGNLVLAFATLANAPLFVAHSLTRFAAMLIDGFGAAASMFGAVIGEVSAAMTNGFNTILSSMMAAVAGFTEGVINMFPMTAPFLQEFATNLRNTSAALDQSVQAVNPMAGLAADAAALAVGLRASADGLEAMGFDVDAITGALGELASITYDEAKERALSVARLRELNAELLNAPVGFALERARRQAIDPSAGLPSFVEGAAQARGASSVTIQSVQLAARDLGEFVEQIDQVQQSQRVAQKGTPVIFSTLVQS